MLYEKILDKTNDFSIVVLMRISISVLLLNCAKLLSSPGDQQLRVIIALLTTQKMVTILLGNLVANQPIPALLILISRLYVVKLVQAAVLGMNTQR